MKFYLLLLFTLFLNNTFSQLKTKTIKEAINKADSIWLVSHTLTYQRIIKDNKENAITTMVLIVNNGRVNHKIIKEKIEIAKSEKSKLINILTQKNKDSLIEEMQCFLPHHSILFFKNNKVAYLDICFGCKNLIASKGLGIKDINYPKIMWKQLEELFLTHQIPMELK